MQIDNPIRLVRELKGAPISIILGLSFSTVRVTQEWIERATGYTDKPVSQALAYLQEIGLVDHTRAGWQLTGDGKQLPLGLALEQSRQGLALEESTTETQIEEDPVSPKSGEIQSQSPAKNAGQSAGLTRNISDSLIIITNTDSLNSEGGSNNNNNGPPSRNFSDSDTISPELFEQNLAALGAARVTGRKRQELARLDHVTPGYVRAWEAQLRHELGRRYKPGILICTVEGGAPAPEVRSNGHVMTCACEECRRMAYQ